MVCFISHTAVTWSTLWLSTTLRWRAICFSFYIFLASGLNYRHQNEERIAVLHFWKGESTALQNRRRKQNSLGNNSVPNARHSYWQLKVKILLRLFTCESGGFNGDCACRTVWNIFDVVDGGCEETSIFIIYRYEATLPHYIRTKYRHCYMPCAHLREKKMLIKNGITYFTDH